MSPLLSVAAALQCPVCSKDIPSSDMEAHMSQCMSRPRVTYNGESSVFHVCLTFLCSCFQLTLLHRTLESAVSALMTWYQVIHNNIAISLEFTAFSQFSKEKRLSGFHACVSTISSMYILKVYVIKIILVPLL